MIKILNTDKSCNSPLQRLLRQCIVAQSGGSTSDMFCECCKIDGWTHEFLGWEQGSSSEALFIRDEETAQKLIAIIQSY